MRRTFQFSLKTLLWTSAIISGVMAAAAGTFGETVQLAVFGTAAYLLIALLLLATYVLLAVFFLAPLALFAWLLERARIKRTEKIASTDASMP